MGQALGHRCLAIMVSRGGDNDVELQEAQEHSQAPPTFASDRTENDLAPREPFSCALRSEHGMAGKDLDVRRQCFTHESRRLFLDGADVDDQLPCTQMGRDLVKALSQCLNWNSQDHDLRGDVPCMLHDAEATLERLSPRVLGVLKDRDTGVGREKGSNELPEGTEADDGD